MSPKRKPHNPAPLPSDQLAQQALKDPSFQEQVLKLRDLFAKRHPGITFEQLIELSPEEIAELKEQRNNHSEPYISNEDGSTRQKLILKECKDRLINSRVKKLSNDYAIEPYWIELCINSPFPRPEWFDKPVRKSRFETVEKDDGLYIKIFPNTNLDDISDRWDSIEMAKKAYFWQWDNKVSKFRAYKPTSNRPIDDPELLYAIHRARRNGETFPHIYDLYQKGELPYYTDKPTNQFSSSKAIENFYNRYKPITI